MLALLIKLDIIEHPVNFAAETTVLGPDEAPFEHAGAAGSRPTERVSIVLIPGIGGHPAFHSALIEKLSLENDIYTSPYGDFDKAPFKALAEHVSFWENIVKAAPAGAVLVGISFGAQIAMVLSPKTLKRFRAIVLVSWWPLGTTERTLIALLEAMPNRLSAWLVGRTFFFAAERMMNLVELRRLRLRLYDRVQSAHERLLGRLLCLRSLRPNSRLLGHNVTIIYGRHELALILVRLRQPQLWVRAEKAIIKGDHGISVSAGPLIDCLLMLLDDLRGRKDVS